MDTMQDEALAPAAAPAAPFNMPPHTGLGLAATLALAGCGGGGGGPADDTVTAQAADDSRKQEAAAGVTTPALSREQAARFLAQAAFGGNAADIARLQTLGCAGWLEAEFAKPLGTGYLSLIAPGGLDHDDADSDGRQGIERALWRKAVNDTDVLRQRMTLALSEIFVVSIASVTLPMRGHACAALLDIFQRNAFGNYRDLLMQVSTSAAMGAYLTFLNNKKADPGTGSQPDENYARELMQLFSIGLFELQLDGSPVANQAGEPKETYDQDDVSGLARVFTGWVLSESGAMPYDKVTQPMRMNDSNHETGKKVFLGTTIPAGTGGARSLEIAVDTLMNHPSMAPFIARQLIQRFVTSHPSAAYVRRVASTFQGNGSPIRGDLKATLRAVLLDPEALGAANAQDITRGKLREPMLRFLQWARLFKLPPGPRGWYGFGNLSDPATELGQSPLRAPSVFNFFRPGHVPPNSELGRRGITAPEFQITTESSVAGYLNFMLTVIENGLAGSRPDHADWLPLAGDSAALLAELNVVLAAGQVSSASLARLKTALDTIAVASEAGKRRRLQAALTMLMALTEYLVLQ